MTIAKILTAFVLALLLASCATQPSVVVYESTAVDSDLQAKLARASEQGEAGRALRDGVTALQAGDNAKANKAFSRAVKLDPDNPRLHLLNAIAYHVGYARGVRVNRDLAETGYLVALRMDPNNVVAAEMLGQLYLDSGRFGDARRWIAQSLLMGQTSARSLHSFAVASYYEQDVPLALWAITQAEGLDGKSSPILRAGAMIRAAAGQFEAAETTRLRYDAVEPDALLKRSLAQRVAQWRTTLVDIDAASDAASADPKAAPIVLAQAPASAAGGSVASAAALAAPPRDPAPVSALWSDCAGSVAPPTNLGGAGSANTAADETIQLPPLPSPCTGRPLPRMAVVNVTIVRTQDTISTNKGMNLLDSLAVTLGGNLLDYARNYVRGTGGTGTANTTQTNRSLQVSLGTATGGAAGITYSLNIANATDQANEVIARPSLLVLDRQPSTFFSGSILSTVPTATGFGGSNRVDHPTGVSLSVTPTFIDDDSMLLSVKAGRSFFQDPTRLDLSGTVLTTRNMATANVRIRFNETLVLSGLSEREIQENESGVPLLKEVPILQYLFKTESTLNYSHTIMVLLTPRNPNPAAAEAKQAEAERPVPEVAELRSRAVKGWKLTPNLDVVMAQMERRTIDRVGLYRAFRSGDLESQVWHHPRELQGIISEIASFLYY